MKNTALNIILTIYLVIVVGAYLIGAKPLIVVSNSMAPTISKGDLLIVIKKTNYQVNEIISFKNKGGLSTHRIKSIINNDFKTKGDANQLEDFGIIKNNQVLGKVELIFPSLGFLILFFQSKYFAYLLTLVLIYFFIKKIKHVKK